MDTAFLVRYSETVSANLRCCASQVFEELPQYSMLGKWFLLARKVGRQKILLEGIYIGFLDKTLQADRDVPGDFMANRYSAFPLT